MAAVKQARQALRDADRKVRAEFAGTEQNLRQANLPAEILQRHAEAVRSYHAKHTELDTELTEAENAHERITDHRNFQDRAPDHARLRQHLSKASDLLETHTPRPRYQPLNPHKLPSRPAEPRWKAPQTNSRILPTYARPGSPWLAAQDTLDPAYVTQVAAGSDALVAQVLPKASGLPTAPTAADLAPTEDVQITQEIRDLAAELGNDPVRIYEYVRNTIDFEPTWGSIKGSVLTLWERSGNAFDTASLLIVLFRAANIPARYVLGTIQVPAAQAQNWLGGVTTPQIAATILASGGVPTSYTATSVTLEHVWVEAYVPFGHYRGVPLGTSGKTWIPLDASFKQYTYIQGLDVPAIVGFDADTFLQQVMVGATTDPSTGAITRLNQAYVEDESARAVSALSNYIDTNLPRATVAAVSGGRSVTGVSVGVLPATLPHKAVALTADASALPESLRHRVSLELLDGSGLGSVVFLARSLPAAATSRLTISYGPATAVDRAILESFATQGVTSVPVYLVSLIPEIRIDGVVVATGPPLGMGQPQTVVVTLEGPNQAADRLSHERLAGDYSALGIELGNSSGGRLAQRQPQLLRAKRSIEQRQISEVTKDDIVGEMLHTTALLYWVGVSFVARTTGSLYGVFPIRLPSEALNSSATRVTYAFGAPLTAEPGGLTLDVKRSLVAPLSLRGDSASEHFYALMLGVVGSYLEGATYEQIFRKPQQGVSTIHVLRSANSQGIPLYRVSQSNSAAVLPLLAVPDEVAADIRDAVAAGKVVYVPGSESTLNGWTGIGYAVTDPATGAGAYQISGRLSGGFFIDVLWASVFLLSLGTAIESALPPAPGPLTIADLLDAHAYASSASFTERSPAASDTPTCLGMCRLQYAILCGLFCELLLHVNLGGWFLCNVCCFVASETACHLRCAGH